MTDRHPRIGTGQVRIGRIQGEHFFQGCHGFLVPAALRKEDGFFAAEPGIIRIIQDASLDVRLRIVRSVGRVPESPVIGGIHLQEDIAHGHHPRRSPRLVRIADNGHRLLFVEVLVEYAGKTVVCPTVGLLQQAQGPVFVPLLFQKIRAVGRHLIGGIVEEPLVQFHLGLVEHARFPIAQRETPDGILALFGLLGLGIDIFQRCNGSGILAVGHQPGGIFQHLLTISQVDIILARELFRRRFQGTAGRNLVAFSKEDIVFQHAQPGRGAGLGAHFPDIGQGIVVIPPADRLRQHIFQRFRSLARAIDLSIKLIGIGILLHAGRVFHQGIVQALQFGRRMQGKLAPHQGKGSHVTAVVHHDTGGPPDQFHIARILIRCINQLVQGGVQAAFADEQVRIGDLGFDILRVQQDHCGQSILRSIQIAAHPRFLICSLQDLVHIGRNTRIMRIYLVQTTQELVGHFQVPLLLVQVDLSEPEAFPVRIHFQQFIHIADGAGIIPCRLLYIHQQLFGVDMVIVDMAGFYQVIASLVVILAADPVPPRQVVEVRIVRILFQTLVQQGLSLCPMVLDKEGTHLVHVVSGKLTPFQRSLGRDRQDQGCDQHHQYADNLTH